MSTPEGGTKFLVFVLEEAVRLPREGMRFSLTSRLSPFKLTLEVLRLGQTEHPTWRIQSNQGSRVYSAPMLVVIYNNDTPGVIDRMGEDSRQ